MLTYHNPMITSLKPLMASLPAVHELIPLLFTVIIHSDPSWKLFH